MAPYARRLAAALFVLTAGALVGACGDRSAAPAPEGRAGPPATPQAGEPASDAPRQASEVGVWRDLASARPVARARGLPLLVLVRAPGQPCPPADRIRDELYADAALDADCVRALAEAGPGASEEEFEFISRARRLQPIPPLLVVATPDLEILHLQTSRIMGIYSVSGECLPDDPGPILTVAELRDVIRAAVARKPKVDQELEELARSSVPEARLTRAEVLARRGRWKEARDTIHGALSARLSARNASRLYDLLLLLDAPDRAAAVAASTLAFRRGEQGSGWLRLRWARNSPQVPASVRLARLSNSIGRAQRLGCHRLEACLRALRLKLSAESSVVPLAEDLEATERTPSDLFGAFQREGAWFESDLASAALARGDLRSAEKHILDLLRDHPDAPEALMYRHGLLDRVRRRAAGASDPVPAPPMGPSRRGG